jgi:hypothetical protein
VLLCVQGETSLTKNWPLSQLRRSITGGPGQRTPEERESSTGDGAAPGLYIRFTIVLLVIA